MFKVGKNSIELRQDQQQNYSWHLQIVQPETLFAHSKGALEANGVVQNWQSTPEISAKVHAQSFSLNECKVTNLQANLATVLQADAPVVANIRAVRLRLEIMYCGILSLSLAVI